MSGQSARCHSPAAGLHSEQLDFPFSIPFWALLGTHLDYITAEDTRDSDSTGTRAAAGRALFLGPKCPYRQGQSLPAGTYFPMKYPYYVPINVPAGRDSISGLKVWSASEAREAVRGGRGEARGHCPWQAEGRAARTVVGVRLVEVDPIVAAAHRTQGQGHWFT